ncbi:hypothetical protein EVAR_3778_1 [Eumeta japonica]|uniref:Uncharacterized protein n=1 Tax=Eumeta variegata TaxID=151549 RepID=A0A4C1SU73_EUMVA|nr:hypothetical protein EVAR_3778_1 [Eumeta japonica]
MNTNESRIRIRDSFVFMGHFVMASFAGADVEPPTSAHVIAHAHFGRWRGAPGMRSGNRRSGADPAAHVACPPATASIARSGPLYTAQAAHAVDCRPSDVNGPPTAGQGSTYR